METRDAAQRWARAWAGAWPPAIAGNLDDCGSTGDEPMPTATTQSRQPPCAPTGVDLQAHG